MTTAASPVIDVNDRDFETAVIERSRTTPVVVDFWAPWCGPCRVLGPALERLATEMQGAFVLAKVNVDENPAVSRRFGVQGIPMVNAFRDGAVVDSFTGALPESRVRAWLRKLIPSGPDLQASEAARLAATDPQAAMAKYRAALEQDPAHEESLIGLGRMLAFAGDAEGAEILRRVSAGSKRRGEAQSLVELANFLQTPAEGATGDGDGATAASPVYAAAAACGRDGDWEGALKQLLQIVQREGVREGGSGDRARRAMLAIFTALGDTDPLVPRYRRMLASALF
jgi:putative thioredoxin